MKRNIVLLLLFFLSTAAASAQSFKVESPDGSQVAEISASIVDGKLQLNITLDGLAAGNYMVTVNVNGEVYSAKFIKL